MKLIKGFLSEHFFQFILSTLLILTLVGFLYIPPLFESSCDVNHDGVDMAYEVPEDAIESSVKSGIIVSYDEVPQGLFSKAEYELTVKYEDGTIERVEVFQDDYPTIKKNLNVYKWRYTTRPYKTYEERRDAWSMRIVFVSIPIYMFCIVVTFYLINNFFSYFKRFRCEKRKTRV